MKKIKKDISNKFLNTVTDLCIGVNILLLYLSVSLDDWYLFKIAILSIAALLVGRLYRHYAQKEKYKK